MASSWSLSLGTVMTECGQDTGLVISSSTDPHIGPPESVLKVLQQSGTLFLKCPFLPYSLPLSVRSVSLFTWLLLLYLPSIFTSITSKTSLALLIPSWCLFSRGPTLIQLLLTFQELVMEELVSTIVPHVGKILLSSTIPYNNALMRKKDFI